MKYLCTKAQKPEFLGKTPMDAVYIEQLNGVIVDQVLAIYPLLTTTDEPAAYEKVFNEKLYPKMEELNKFLTDKKFIVGDYLTWLDFIFAEFLEFIQTLSLTVLKVNLLEKYKNFGLYLKNFQEIPQIIEFFTKDENEMPFLPPAYSKIKI